MQAARVARSPQTTIPPPAKAPSPARAPAPSLPSRFDATPPVLRLGPKPAPGPAAALPLSLAGLVQAPGVGEALPGSVRTALETSLMVDLEPVRVHADPRAAAVVDQLPARAFTFGERVFLGSKERPTDLALMAHEVAHVVQQHGAPVTQMATFAISADPLEVEARRVSEAVVRGEPATVRGQTAGARPQALFEGAEESIRRVAE